MKKTAIIFSIIILVVSCLPKFTEINDQGFGGGMKVNQFKLANKNESELNLSLESKKDKVVINSESVKTGLLDSTELTTVQSNIQKQEIKPNKTVAKLNKIFYPLMPKAVKQKFEKTIDSKPNIFQYKGKNKAMTIGYYMFIYGLLAAVLSLTIGIISILVNGFNLNSSSGDAFLGFVFLLGIFNILVGGLVFLISGIVS
jgi:hypothetical protein